LHKISEHRHAGLLLALSLGLALVYTWPLAGSLASAIPFSLHPLPGMERAPLVPGDHLQTYYWFWLLSDNLFGGSALFSNPYEFAAGAGMVPGNYANFPYSLLYLLFLPLGPAGAYNALMLLSFPLSALAGYLLARSHCGDPWAAMLAGLALAVAPFRVSQVAAGQLFGLVAFLLPLTLYFADRAWATARLAPGWAAGACALALGLMEPHLAYFLALTLGLYLPGRLLLERPVEQPPSPGDPARPWPELAAVLAGGLALAVFAALALGRTSGVYPWASALPAWLGAALAGWLTLSALAHRLTVLSFAAARRRVGLCFLAFVPLAAYAVQLKLDVPHLGRILLALSLGLFLAGLARIWRRRRDPLPMPAWRRLAAAGLGLGAGLGLAVVFLLRQRASTLLGSLAGAGRDLREVLLFSPRPESLWTLGGAYDERYIYLGLVFAALALLGLLPLLGRNPRDPGRRALAGLMAFLAVVLTLGPGLTGFPLYRLLYTHVPFFSYPRVPARFIVLAFVFMGPLTAYFLSGLRQWLGSRPRLARYALPAVLGLTLLALPEYHTCHPVGLSTFPVDGPVRQALADPATAPGPVLELPLWPGDSHQSSAYEYNLTRTRRAMVNGYSPVVARRFIEEVFWPLSGLNLGELGPAQAAALERLGVNLVTFHDDFMLYPLKVSPFPPSLALKRLLASGRLAPLAREDNLHLLRLRGEPAPLPLGSLAPAEVTSPVSAVWYAHNLTAPTGRREFDKELSGHGLQLAEDGQRLRRNALGNLTTALPGRDAPGILAGGPGQMLPPGRYLARFRLRGGGGAGGPQALPGPLGEIALGKRGQPTPLAARTIGASDLANGTVWVDLPLPFALAETTWVEPRVGFAGNGPLAFNLVVVSFVDVAPGPAAWPATELFRQCGVEFLDPEAQAGQGGPVVFARAGIDPPLHMLHGPYRTIEAGSYRAVFRLRAPASSPGAAGLKPGTPLAVIEAATDMGRKSFAKSEIRAGDLAGTAYGDLALDFSVPFRCELDLRVRFLGAGDLMLERVGVTPVAPVPAPTSSVR
jgi:hypothetical protein